MKKKKTQQEETQQEPQQNNEIEESQIFGHVIDDSTGNIILRLVNCDFPVSGDKIMLRTENFIAEFLVTKRTMAVDTVDGYMTWNIYVHVIGSPIVNQTVAGNKNDTDNDELVN